MKKILYILSVIAVISSCNLKEDPKAETGRSIIFGTEFGLKSYCYSFYEYLPQKDAYFKINTTGDNVAKNNIGAYELGAYTENTSTSWSWTAIRNVNYFIQYNTDPAVDQVTRDNYTGIAKFFRAYLYYDKLVKYGEVPWIDRPLDPNSDQLYAPRDNRDVIISNIIDDLNYAYEHITEKGITASSNTVNKWTALALKSRICLFEGTFRKYHKSGGSQYGDDYLKGCTLSWETLLEEAAEAAHTVIMNGPYKIHTTANNYEAGGRGAYRDLFISEETVTEEVMLALTLNDTHLGEANWYLNSSSYGPHCCMTRSFAKTYLNIDGTTYNEKNSLGAYKTFDEETKNRDYRLCQTIRGADYTMKDANGNYTRTSANFAGHTLTGYQITKLVIDDVAYEDKRSNTNDYPYIRYAEVLLNYAEAKAELGTITDDDWSKTIGTLRRRAGIKGGDLDNKPTVVDNFLKNTFYPNITDPCILEVRRDRAIELFFEGFRLNDLKRWALGKNWQNVKWDGVYIPALDTELDMNGDGVADVYVTKSSSSGSGKIRMVVSDDPDDKLDQKIEKLSDDPNGGYILYYRLPRKWNENMYLYPIPEPTQQKNPNLSQNPGWISFTPSK
ncbi:MAG: RagB/SusD family nutrient uptake outer membrane protein [Bacteroidales bacterium]|nr:RagB/SusD family nutrient uptake outer membrane protein [Bacteroidales bacterium]